jgi:ferrous iron transport protein A
MHELLPISALLPGQVAEVRQIVGRPDQVRRLAELGLRNGVRLEMVQAGTPCIVRIGVTKLCFRDGEMCSVLVAARMSA